MTPTCRDKVEQKIQQQDIVKRENTKTLKQVDCHFYPLLKVQTATSVSIYKRKRKYAHDMSYARYLR